jgi:hypothetical protein
MKTQIQQLPGLYEYNPVETHSLQAPGFFKPLSLSRRQTGFSSICSFTSTCTAYAEVASTDVMRLLAGKKATTLSDLPAQVGGEATMTAIRGSDTLSDLAALSAGAAVVRGSGGCALVAIDVAPAAKTNNAKVLESWPLVPGTGACAAAVSAVFVESEATKAAARVAVVTADAAAGTVTHAVLSLAGEKDAAAAAASVYSYTSAPVAGYAPTDHGAPVAAWAHAYPIKKVGLYKLKSVITHSLQAPGCNP